MACKDGWLGINLARDSDWTLLNAWLETDVRLTDWPALKAALIQRSGLDLLDRGREMGLPWPMSMQTVLLQMIQARRGDFRR